jgi:hypothetical protein
MDKNILCWFGTSSENTFNYEKHIMHQQLNLKFYGLVLHKVLIMDVVF